MFSISQQPTLGILQRAVFIEIVWRQKGMNLAYVCIIQWRHILIYIAFFAFSVNFGILHFLEACFVVEILPSNQQCWNPGLPGNYHLRLMRKKEGEIVQGHNCRIMRMMLQLLQVENTMQYSCIATTLFVIAATFSHQLALIPQLNCRNNLINISYVSGANLIMSTQSKEPGTHW
jgi:hypothetical protein